MGWISIKDQLPPSDGTRIHTWNKIYGPTYTEVFAGIALQHIHHDIRQLGYSRVTHWAYAKDEDLAELFGNEKAEEMRREKKIDLRSSKAQESASNSEKAQEEVSDLFSEEDASPIFQETENPTAAEWTSENGKWTVKVNSEKNRGNLIDNKLNKVYIWNITENGLKITGVKAPKYVSNKILEMVDK